MIRHVLASSIFAAGALLTGTAVAQTETGDVPIAHVVNGGRVGNGGCVAPNGCVAPAPAAVAVPPAAPATYSAGYGSEPSTWQSSTGGVANSASQSEVYTFALNDLYSKGFHNVHHLWMQDGMVQADAVTPYGNPRTVAVDPQSGRISLG